MRWAVPLYQIYHDQEDQKAVEAVIDRGSGWTNGPENVALEKELAAHTNRKYAVSFNNGTSALHAMLLAHGVGPGDEVIVPSFTFVSTANAALFVGARPIFADIEEKTFALDPDDVRKKITPKTKAIMAVHYAGSPASRTEELRELAREKGILFLEDNAESLGSKLDGKMVGSFGDSAILSFCANKIITCGEGGAVITDSEEIYDKLVLLRSHGRDEKGKTSYFNSTTYLDYISLGFNMRLPSINAALALSQLRKIDRLIGMRRTIAKRYDKAFQKHVAVMPDSSSLQHVYQMYTIRLESNRQREDLKSHLEKKLVFSKVYFPPVHKTHFYQNVRKCDAMLPQTECISDTVLTIPIYPSMSEIEIDLVVNSVAEYFQK